MRLFIDVAYASGTDLTDKANWESFQYIVNRLTPESDSVTLLEASSGGWNWDSVGQVKYRASGNRIQIQIPRSMLGIESEDFILNFKWSDNMQTDGDVMDFYVHGDAAPGGRYKYQFAAGKPPVAAEKSSKMPWIAAGAVLATGIGAAVGITVYKKSKNKGV